MNNIYKFAPAIGIPIVNHHQGPVAQLDRASDYGSEG